ncbi:MAG: hypothetical protein HYW10_02370 [Candidatus Omnitrophica bacterium]|nr:hypothetical protein [Candidatus Omnitrophota bacterium]
MTQTTIPFTKMVGTGNDFVVVNAGRNRLAALRSEWRSRHKAWRVRHVLWRRRGAGEQPVTVETIAGVLSATVHGDQVAMRMTNPTALRLGLNLDVGGRAVRLLGFVNTGVPHAVVPVKRIDSIDVTRIGRALRYHRAFAPRGSNVNFVQADAKRTNRLRVRTYERGVEEETLACGTGVAASAVLYALRHEGRGRGNGVLRGSRSSCRRRIEVETRSGEVLTVAFTVTGEGSSRRVSDVVLQGAAARVFEGEVSWSPRRRT